VSLFTSALILNTEIRAIRVSAIATFPEKIRARCWELIATKGAAVDDQARIGLFAVVFGSISSANVIFQWNLRKGMNIGQSTLFPT
jgi:hypothetical protein